MIVSILVAISLALIALITAAGNLVVVLAFVCEKNLRTINGNSMERRRSNSFSPFFLSDYFILNMAIADFLVGSFCIPFYIPYRSDVAPPLSLSLSSSPSLGFSLTQSWPFGRLFCRIWVSDDTARKKHLSLSFEQVTVDDVATMASVINIVAISVNRYWSIAYPISYRRYARQNLVYLVMGSVWCFSFCESDADDDDD